MKDRLGDVLACLDDLEVVACEPYRHFGAGRPPRKPTGILKALMVKRFRNIPSDRQLYRRLWSDRSLGAYATLKSMRSLIIFPSLRVSDSA